MESAEKTITEMQRNLEVCAKYLDSLAKGYRSPEKVNTLLDAAMQHVELCCINMRQLCEKTRMPLPAFRFGNSYHHEEIFGSVTQMDTGWIDIRLNALLPHCKFGGTQYVADSITRLLDNFHSEGGNIPMFDKAYVAIVEHCTEDTANVFDPDNKGFKAVINALKGRMFPDDNQFELSLGLFTCLDEDICCHVYIMPFASAGDFAYQMPEL